MLLDYTPTPRQLLFHSLNFPVKVLITGNGFGKTRVNVVEAYINATELFPGEVGLVVCPSYGLLNQGWLQTWREMVPSNEYKLTMGTSNARIVMRSNGSEILLKTSSGGEYSLAGPNVAWLCFDEATEESEKDNYYAAHKRPRKSRSGLPPRRLITTVPGQNTTHWACEVWGTGVDGVKWFPVPNPFNPTEDIRDCWQDVKGQICVLQGSTWDNPHIQPSTQDYVENTICSMGATKEHIDRFVFGKWVNYSGAVLPEWNPAKHIVNDLPELNEGGSRQWMCIDWGDTDEGAVLVIQQVGDRVYVRKEHYHKAMIYDRDQGWGKIFLETIERERVWRCVVDPANASLARLYRTHFQGLNWLSADKGPGSIEKSITMMRTLMMKDKFFVHSSCKNFIKELSGLQWNQRTGAIKGLYGDHLFDACRYHLLTAYQGKV